MADDTTISLNGGPAVKMSTFRAALRALHNDGVANPFLEATSAALGASIGLVSENLEQLLEDYRDIMAASDSADPKFRLTVTVTVSPRGGGVAATPVLAWGCRRKAEGETVVEDGHPQLPLEGDKA